MPRYLVHNVLTPFAGLPYSGPAMKEAGYDEDAVADFEKLDQATECADKLHAVVDSGWLVVHSFNERVLYDSRSKQRVG